MIPIHAALVLLAAHWIGDFVLQSDRIAKAKAVSGEALDEHIMIYTGVLALAALPLMGPAGLIFLVLNGPLHHLTDAITAPITKRLHEEGRTHDFFVMVGFDQLVHVATLLLTLQICFGLV